MTQGHKRKLSEGLPSKSELGLSLDSAPSSSPADSGPLSPSQSRRKSSVALFKNTFLSSPFGFKGKRNSSDQSTSLDPNPPRRSRGGRPRSPSGSGPLDSRTSTPQDLNPIFNEILFSDRNLFIVRYLFAHQEDFEKQKELIRAVVEIAMVEGLIVDLLFEMICLEYQHEDRFRLRPLPVMELVDSRDKKSKRLQYSHTATQFVPWMLFQALTILRGTSLIMKIDIANNRTAIAMLKKVRALNPSATPPEGENTTQVDHEHPLHLAIQHLFPEHHPSLVMPAVFEACESIMSTVLQSCEKNLPLDVKNLVQRYTRYAQEQLIAEEYSHHFLFWCFLFPILNLTTIITRRRSNMSPENYGAFLVCFLVIREAALREALMDMFCTISPEDQERMDRLHQQFLEFVAQLELYEDKSLAEKVLNMNTTADEEKSQLLLIEAVDAHIEDIYEKLLQDPQKHEDLLTRLLPFAQVGFQKSFPSRR